MRGMMRNVALALAAMSHGAAYAAGRDHVTFDIANAIIGGAERHTTKQMAVMRGRGPDGATVYVPSKRWVDRSSYRPHQGVRECARRVRQMGAA